MAFSLDTATLEAALVGYSQQLRQIEAKMEEIRRILSGSAGGASMRRATTGTPARQKHQMSAEGRARIAAAQRARWAKVKNAG